MLLKGAFFGRLVELENHFLTCVDGVDVLYESKDELLELLASLVDELA